VLGSIFLPTAVTPLKPVPVLGSIFLPTAVTSVPVEEDLDTLDGSAPHSPKSCASMVCTAAERGDLRLIILWLEHKKDDGFVLMIYVVGVQFEKSHVTAVTNEYGDENRDVTAIPTEYGDETGWMYIKIGCFGH
jgi:hypothetical protein